MSWLHRLFRRRKVETELDEEIRFYLEQETQLRIDRGETPEQAREAARRDFGNVTLVKETTRQMWGWRLIDDLSRRGTTVLVTTHYLDEAERCDRVAIIHAGRLAAIGTTAELKQRFDDRPILELRAPDPVAVMTRLEAVDLVEKTSLFGTGVHAVLRSREVTPADIRRHANARYFFT